MAGGSLNHGLIFGDIAPSSADPNAVTNPILIVEVLSKTTSAFDRGDKFFLYRQIDTLQEYVLIEQHKAQVEIYQREAGLWKITRVSGLGQSIALRSIGLEIRVEEIYRDVLPEEES